MAEARLAALYWGFVSSNLINLHGPIIPPQPGLDLNLDPYPEIHAPIFDGSPVKLKWKERHPRIMKIASFGGKVFMTTMSLAGSVANIITATRVR